MKPIIPILILFSGLWIFGGSYYMANSSCNVEGDAIAPLIISDEATGFTTKSMEHFSFLPSTATLSLEAQTTQTFADVAKYLADHADRQLILNGWYLSKETNDSKFETLGLARAESVKAYLLTQEKSIVHQIGTSSQVKSSIPTANDKFVDAVTFTFAPLLRQPQAAKSEEAPSKAPVVNNSLSPALVLYGQSEFLNLKMDINMQQQLDNMQAALDLNPGAYILVTGHANQMNGNTKSYDMAYVWASKVRRFFRNNGVRSKKIKATSRGAKDPLVAADAPNADIKNNRVTVEVTMPK